MNKTSGSVKKQKQKQNKTSGSDGIPVELFQILIDDVVKVPGSKC